MICLRCGYCCKQYMVVVVDDPKRGITNDNLKARKGDEPCQHLQGDKPGEFSCALHDYPWYKETPCFSHGQIEQKNSNCRLGEYILQNGINTN